MLHCVEIFEKQTKKKATPTKKSTTTTTAREALAMYKFWNEII